MEINYYLSVMSLEELEDLRKVLLEGHQCLNWRDSKQMLGKTRFDFIIEIGKQIREKVKGRFPTGKTLVDKLSLDELSLDELIKVKARFTVNMKDYDPLYPLEDLDMLNPDDLVYLCMLNELIIELQTVQNEMKQPELEKGK